MTDAQKVGQVMIWSMDGTRLSPAVSAHLEAHHPGAIIFFRRNIVSLAQVANFNRDLRTLATAHGDPAPFAMVDQEGGMVTRIRTATPLPSALALGELGDAGLVRRFAGKSAEVLKLVGFNVNLAPVLDVSNPERRSFIGNRTFGDDPKRVARLTDAFALGLADGGLMPTAKHFPGHGDTIQNSHFETPRRLATIDQMKHRDLVPFEEYASVDAPRAVMMAHLALPNVDPSGLPATFSSVMIETELRRHLGYRGLVITDDLEMMGAGISDDIGERAVRAFLAGNDMLMFAGSVAHQKRAFDALLEAVSTGRVPKARLDASVARILAAKARLGPAPRFDVARVTKALRELDELSAIVLRRNFVAASARAHHAWPAFTKDRVIPVLSGSPLFSTKFRAAFAGPVRFAPLTKDSLTATVRALEATDGYAVYFASGQISARWLNALPRAQKARLIVVNCNDPGQVSDQDAFLSVFNVNSYFTDGGTWLAEELGPRHRALANVDAE
jgi:beta-N-acetylhexosaminidase